jgi:hypothetical protein
MENSRKFQKIIRKKQRMNFKTLKLANRTLMLEEVILETWDIIQVKALQLIKR